MYSWPVLVKIDSEYVILFLLCLDLYHDQMNNICQKESICAVKNIKYCLKNYQRNLTQHTIVPLITIFFCVYKNFVDKKLWFEYHKLVL